MRSIFKWIPRVIVCVLILFVLTGVIAYWVNKPGDPPSAKEAPWAIQSYSDNVMKIPSRIYYAYDLESKPDGGVKLLSPYWSYNGVKYNKQSKPKDIAPPVDIIRRKME
jgi:hypothetical protein